MHKDRALLVALAVLVVVFTGVTLYQKGPGNVPWLPSCLFNKATGLYCPGCGMTRATHAVFHGDLAKGFRMNPVGMILFPVALVGMGFEVLAWVRDRKDSFRLRVGPGVAWSLAVIMILFWIFRNIPFWPFELLAPH